MTERSSPPTSSPGSPPQAEEELRFTLRGSVYLFSLIDEARARRPGKISRNTWILEAITEKLMREQKSSW
ncbi:hypothetical protein SAMN06265365_101138 [Tistlia consotensis]|uniref:Uncharacterized protein n=1 Tax=Tistlia consotensis USBA 355 TaxID=560819 RepID=A0A1Y6B2Z0_9PROT|nr:hypothetical protein [Tistlia consotensis]SME88772.1 hypothetical protein SAMN05428998_101138 [Tistlia consotensis USBA 355]SNR25314.1 hypothetical protein SAMN06265365_101138 [Tistlia consotensis]